MKHELKCWPEYFEPLARGVKTFEVRRMDRPFALLDTLLLREWLPSQQEYTDRFVHRRIVYILAGGKFGLDPDYCVLGLAPL